MKKAVLMLSLLLAVVGVSIAQEELTLSKAIEIGLESSYNIKISESSESIAVENNRWGNAGRYPTFDFALSGGVANVINEGSGTNVQSYSSSAAVNMSWLLFGGFSVNITKEQLQTNEELTGGQTVVLIENTISDIITGWYTALVEKEKISVFEETLKISEDRYHQAEHAKEIGTETTYELLQFKNSYLEDKSNLALQKMAFRNSLRYLNYTMGVDPNRDWIVAGELEAAASEFIYSDLESKMLSNNSTIKNQYISQKLLEQNVRLSKSDLKPSISFSGSVNGAWADTNPEGYSDGFSSTQQGALTLSYSLYNGGNRNSAIAIAEINEYVGELNIADMENSMKTTLLVEADNYSVRQELVSLAAEQVKAAKLNLEISKDKYKMGAINSFNYRDVQLIHLNAAISKLNAELNSKLSYIELIRLTGGIMSEY